MSYREVRPLAKGGMGTVSLVVKQEGRFRRAYALKRLLPDLRSDPDVRAMFLREAEIAGLLHHPNVVSVVDVGEDREGPFLVMDYVRGVSLHQLLKALSAARTRLSPLHVAQIFEPVARGLEAAHTLTDHAGQKLGLVHRDVSPSNILVAYDGSAHLTDFGIAKAVIGHDKTSTGILKGKLGYLAPEQLQFHDATVASDVYSLGVSMFEALAGKRLFRRARPADTARAILEDPPPDLYDIREDVHPALEELVLSMLAKHPDDRPSSAGEVASRLESMREELRRESAATTLAELLVAHFGEAAATENELLTAVVQPARRRGRMFAGLVGVIGLIGLAGTLAGWGLNPETPPAPPTQAPPRSVPTGPAERSLSTADSTADATADSTAESSAPTPEPSGRTADETALTDEGSARPEHAEPTRLPVPAPRRVRRRPRPASPSESPPAPRDELWGWR